VLHLEDVLGRRPERFRHRRRWDRAARKIERYRARHQIGDSAIPLGPEPSDRLQRLAWRKAQREVEHYRVSSGLGREASVRSRARGL